MHKTKEETQCKAQRGVISFPNTNTEVMQAIPKQWHGQGGGGGSSN